MPLGSLAPCKSPISEARLVYGSRKILSYLPQPPRIISPSEPTISIPIPSEPHTSESNTSSPPLPKFNLTSTSIPVFESILLNEPITPPSYTPSSPPYYDLTSNYEHSEIPYPTSQTLAEFQTTTESEKTQFVP